MLAPTPAAIRIEIHGQGEGGGGACVNPPPLTVQHQMPIELQGRITTAEWTRIKDEINAVLLPLSKTRAIMRWVARAMPFFFMIAFIAFALSGFSSVNSRGGGVSPFVFWALFPIGMLLFAVGQVFAAQQAQQGMQKLREACSEISRRHADLTFHMRDDFAMGMVRVTVGRRGAMHARRQYIEVTLAGGMVPMGAAMSVPMAAATPVPLGGPAYGAVPAMVMAQPVPMAVPAMPAVVVNVEMTPPVVAAQPVEETRLSLADSLEQLATMRDRGLLSEAEFDAKKKDLLACM